MFFSNSLINLNYLILHGLRAYEYMEKLKKNLMGVLGRMKDLIGEVWDGWPLIHVDEAQKAMKVACKVVCLVSGGIDSSVAAWMAMRKGCEPIFIFYDNYPFTDETTYQRALDVMKKLKEYAPSSMLKLYVVPHGEDLVKILRNCPRRLTCILCKRMMYRVAEKVAKGEGAEAIITGEILGEHASQTLRNLYVESEALKELQILRPLIGMDKLDVENLARKIGTFEISTRPALCCSAPPKHPKTSVKLEEVVEAERKLPIESMVEEDLKKAKIIEI